MANKKITDLQLISSITDALNIPGDTTIQTYRFTALQMYTYLTTKFLTATGDLIYSSSGTTAAKLAIGTAQQLIKPVAGVPAWSWPGSVQRSASSTDSINATTDQYLFYDPSGGTFTATLPTAASVAGKVYVLKKTDTTNTIVTIATTSSQTIDGAVGTTLNTQGETLEVVSDGSNWKVLRRYIPAISKNFGTFGVVGGGTLSDQNYWYTRLGDRMFVQGMCTLGTVSATTCYLDLPTGLAIDSAKASSVTSTQMVGRYHRLQTTNATIYDGTNAAGGACFYDGSDTAKVFLATNIASKVFTKVNASSIFGSTEKMTFEFNVPISGWKS